MYLIAQLAKKVKVSVQDIKNYEKIGLIKGKKNASESGKSFVYYDNDAVEIVEIIKACELIGLKTNEISDFIKGWYGNKMSNARRVKILDQQLALFETKMKQLKETHHKLELLRNEIAQFL